MKKKLLWGGILLFVIVEIFLGIHVQPDMSQVGAPPHKIHQIGNWEVPLGGINKGTVYATWGVMDFIIILAFLVTRKLKKIPGRLQALFEIFVGAFDQLCRDTLGEKGRKFLPFVATLFIFICLCNWISLFPIPGFEEPTKDLNTTLGLGIICFFVSHLAAIRYKGLFRYIADYFEPMIEIKGIRIPNIIFAPLNVIGELGKLISHSFRLYGNILGGSIIIQVVSNLTRYIVVPIGLNFFFVIFIGIVQAFVFAMLALTYVAILVQD